MNTRAGAPSKPHMTPEELAPILLNAYGDSRKWLNDDGSEMLRWSAMPDSHRARWMAVAKEAIDTISDDAAAENSGEWSTIE